MTKRQIKDHDSVARVMKLSETTNMMRAIAAAEIAHGLDTFEGAPCYRCLFGGKPAVVVGDCEHWDVMANREKASA